jgi:hypothetical protein
MDDTKALAAQAGAMQCIAFVLLRVLPFMQIRF